MNTQENNKLIAEFMDKDVALLESVGIEKYTSDELKYHTSWDWLMPVVEKIESLGYDVIIRKDSCEIIGENVKGVEYSSYECFNAGKHITTYQAVVEFINQYNK